MKPKDRLFKKLCKTIKACHKCPGMNKKYATENAPGYGNIRSKVMLIGQSLCGPCMESQIPFTGGSGMILDKVFKRLGVKKKDLFTTNVVHCHPCKNRVSTQEEIDNCISYLYEEICIVRPRLIVTLGRDAMNSILHGHGKWNKLGHTLIQAKRYSIYPAYHPAYHYRRSGKKETQEYILDLARVIKGFM